MSSPQVSAARVSVTASVVILALKAAGYWLTGSVALLSDAAESVVNVVAANVALLSLVIASRPPDNDHPYGHTKAEYVSSSVEAALIIVAAALILLTAVGRLLEPVPLRNLDLGLGLLVGAALGNYGVAQYLFRVGRARDSMALEADARHLMSDVISSAGVLVGLGLARATGLEVLDPIVAILVAMNLGWQGVSLQHRALDGLLDQRLPPEEEARITEILDAHRDEILEYHALRTRKAGSRRFVDLHLVVPRALSVGAAHELSDDLEAHIGAAFPDVDITIHVEPEDSAVAG